MTTEKNSKSIAVNEVLSSLESAISSYNKKDFTAITKNSLAKSKGNKRSVKAIKKEEQEEVLIKNSENKITSSILPKSFKIKKAKSRKIRHVRSFNLSSKFKYLNIFFASIQNYKKQIMTATLVSTMVLFVSISTYIAYAYVSSPSNLDLVGKVAIHMVLPTTETPKIYIIQSEKSEIFQNPLFAGIKVGDNVLTYASIGKVVIYRSSEDKIVNVVNTTQ